MPRWEEASVLCLVGLDVYGREIRLAPGAANAWASMQSAADEAGIKLLLLSGFRSVECQAQILEGKIKAGQELIDILKVSAYPGFSEHHTGRAIDIGCLGFANLTADFERSAAFAWLSTNAGPFGFSLSYPRANPHGLEYEPWHWCHDMIA